MRSVTSTSRSDQLTVAPLPPLAAPSILVDQEEPLRPKSFVLRAVAFGLNLGLFIILFQCYKLARKTFITRGETKGYENAEQIIDWQKATHLFFEPDLQRWILNVRNG